MSKNKIIKMVNRSELVFKRTDPNHMGRGPGFYYNRTWNKEGYKTNYYSKYSLTRDFNYKDRKKIGGLKKLAHWSDDSKKTGTKIPGLTERKLKYMIGNIKDIDKKDRWLFDEIIGKYKAELSRKNEHVSELHNLTKYLSKEEEHKHKEKKKEHKYKEHKRKSKYSSHHKKKR